MIVLSIKPAEILFLLMSAYNMMPAILTGFNMQRIKFCFVIKDCEDGFVTIHLNDEFQKFYDMIAFCCILRD